MQLGDVKGKKTTTTTTAATCLFCVISRTYILSHMKNSCSSVFLTYRTYARLSRSLNVHFSDHSFQRIYGLSSKYKCRCHFSHKLNSLKFLPSLQIHLDRFLLLSTTALTAGRPGPITKNFFLYMLQSMQDVNYIIISCSAPVWKHLHLLCFS